MNAIDEFLEFADQYLNFEKTPEKNIFWLKTMDYLCDNLGRPERNCPCIHVAGSKGKGSVSVMIASILEEAGYRTGLYSSPHIIDFSERIGTVEGRFSEEVYRKSSVELREKVAELKNSLPENRPLTWFELVTVYAMLCFKNAECDRVVYEVGLGGRLDATNVIIPAVCCINTIELEHTEFLGDTVEKIAAEKGGIIKETIPVISAPQKESVKEVLRRIAGEKNAPILFVDEISKISNIVYKNRQKLQKSIHNKIDYSYFMSCSLDSSIFCRPLHPELSLLGEFQARNAMIAACAVKNAFPEISEDVIEKGLSKARLRGRFEILSSVDKFPGIKHLVLDGAHTPKSIGFTIDTLSELMTQEERANLHLVFGCAYDKEVEEMAECFKGKFSRVTLTIPGEVKKCDFERMKRAFEAQKISFTAEKNYKSAIKSALEIASDENAVVLVTGSFYLVSEVIKVIN